MSTTISTPPNALLVEEMTDTFGEEHTLNFATWAACAMPVSFLFMLSVIAVLAVKWCRDIKLNVPSDLVQKEIAKLGDINRDEIWAGIIQTLNSGRRRNQCQLSG